MKILFSAWTNINVQRKLQKVYTGVLKLTNMANFKVQMDIKVEWLHIETKFWNLCKQYWSSSGYGDICSF